MKTKSIVFVLLLYGLYAKAQSPIDKTVRFGIKAGVNGSFFTKAVDPFDDADRRAYAYFKGYFRASGFGGVTADLQLSPHFSMGTELLFNSRGMAYREENDAVVIVDEDGQEQQAYNYYNYNIDYMELPVTFNYNFNNASSKTFLTAYTGIAPGIAISAKTKLRHEESLTGSGRKARDIKEKLNDVRHFNKSLLAGLKVGDNSTDQIGIYGNFRISYTLDSVFDQSIAQNGNNLDTKMMTFSFGFGIRF